MEAGNDSNKNLIFLSYRRDDVPGYVGRLSDELESVYGRQRVFRDVDDIRGGTEWKNVIEQALKESAVLILMIGPRWSDIWRQRRGDAVNYVAMELQLAKDHGITIFPVTLAGASLEPDLDLGDVEWLRQLQQHDISDRQQRWDHDVDALLDLLATVPGMAADKKTSPPVPTPSPKKTSSTLWGGIAAVIVALILGFIFFPSAPPKTSEPSEQAAHPTSSTTSTAINHPQPEDVQPNPLLNRLKGTWVSQKTGLKFNFQPISGNRFRVQIPEKGTGMGQAVPQMPNKIRFKVKNLGEAEFALSNSEEKMLGWYRKTGASNQKYDTLVRTQP